VRLAQFGLTVDLSSNDYLGLRNDARVRAAAIRGIQQFGVGSGGVRDVAVGIAAIREFEERLAAFKSARAVLAVQSGYVANLGIVPVLVGRGDVIFLDQQAHRSSADAAVLSGATVVTYGHADMTALSAALASTRRERDTRWLIATDGVFGQGGDIAPLPEIVELAERHGADVLVDDAHGTGVLGRGRGTVAHFGLTERVAVQVGTASKALGVVGGYVAAPSPEVIARFAESRPVTHSTALPPHLALACIAALDVIEKEPQRVDRLWQNRELLAKGFTSAGMDIGPSETPIVPILVGDRDRTTTLAARMRAAGVTAGVLVPPKVAPEASRLRFTATANHSTAEIKRVVAVVSEAARSIFGTAASSARV
jgi:glycine C-acetyltransferase